MATDEGFTSMPYGDEPEVSLCVNIPRDMAEWLEKVAQLGITRKNLVNSLLLRAREKGIDEFLVDIMREKAKRLGLDVSIEHSTEKSPTTEGVKE